MQQTGPCRCIKAGRGLATQMACVSYQWLRSLGQESNEVEKVRLFLKSTKCKFFFFFYKFPGQTGERRCCESSGEQSEKVNWLWQWEAYRCMGGKSNIGMCCRNWGYIIVLNFERNASNMTFYQCLQELCAMLPYLRAEEESVEESLCVTQPWSVILKKDLYWMWPVWEVAIVCARHS